MTECSACGTQLAPHEIRCPTCGKITAQYHRQRRCMHCGTPAAKQAKTCLMCSKPIDSLPLDKSIFSGSWVGIALGALIIVGIVVGANRYQSEAASRAAQAPAEPRTPTPTFTATPTATRTPLPPTATATASPTPTVTPRVHVVESGDNLLFISQRYGVPLNVLIDFNRIDESTLLNVGQEIVIPPPRGGGGITPRGEGLPPQIVYLVQPGDTLIDIALENGTTVADITRANPNVSLDLIFPGQELIVPLSTPTPTATPTPLPTETPTSGPDYPAPNLLTPADNKVLDESTVLLTWTATRLLADDEFYVVQLDWPNGRRTEHWGQATSLRLSREQRPTNGQITWTVAVMRQLGATPQGQPRGIVISPPGQIRTFEWR